MTVPGENQQPTNPCMRVQAHAKSLEVLADQRGVDDMWCLPSEACAANREHLVVVAGSNCQSARRSTPAASAC